MAGMGLILLGFITIGLLGYVGLTSAASIRSEYCPEGQSRNVDGGCSNCSVCLVGFGVESLCTDDTPTKCVLCPPGHFSDENSSANACEVCNSCEKLGVARECTPQANAECNSCPEGMYLSASLQCKECSPECGPNQFELVTCGGTADRECRYEEASIQNDISAEAETPPQDVEADESYSNTFMSNNTIGSIVGGIIVAIIVFFALLLFIKRKQIKLKVLAFCSPKKKYQGDAIFKAIPQTLEATGTGVTTDQLCGNSGPGSGDPGRCQISTESDGASSSSSSATSSPNQEKSFSSVEQKQIDQAFLFLADANISINDFRKFIHYLFAALPALSQTEIENIEDENQNNCHGKKIKWLNKWQSGRGLTGGLKAIFDDIAAGLKEAELNSTADRFSLTYDLEAS